MKTVHRAQIPSSSDEVSSDGSELEFAQMNDGDSLGGRSARARWWCYRKGVYAT